MNQTQAQLEKPRTLPPPESNHLDPQHQPTDHGAGNPGATDPTGRPKRERKSRQPMDGPRPRRRTRREAQAILRTAVIADAKAATKAEKAALREAHRKQAEALQAATAKTVSPTLDKTPRKQAWGRFTANGLWGPLSPGIPKHVTSSARIGIATLFLAPKTAMIPGPILGLEVHSRQIFTYDPWGAVQAKLVASPGVAVFGRMGRGKSMCVKIAMLRAVLNGRHVIISSDPKGEWVALAQALGGQVLSIGPGTGTVINPLDEGTRPKEVTKAAWHRMVAARRILALESIAHILEPARPMDEREQACLDRVVEAISNGTVAPTIATVVAALQNPSPDLLAEVGQEAPRALALIFGRLVRGPYSGMFDSESTVRLDPAAPMAVVNTKGLYGESEIIRQLAAACSSAWIDATLRSGDGRYRCVVAEEAWDELRNPVQARAMNARLRMTGQWRVSQWLIFHELKDLKQFGEQGSAHREQVEGIFSLSETKILYAQSRDSIKAIREFVELTEAEERRLPFLRVGEGIWHLGTEAPITVYPVVGPRIHQIINTSAGRDGK